MRDRDLSSALTDMISMWSKLTSLMNQGQDNRELVSCHLLKPEQISEAVSFMCLFYESSVNLVCKLSQVRL